MDRREFFASLRNHLTPADLGLVQRAYWLSKNEHRPQVRDSGERYFEHPRDVAILLIERGVFDGRVIVCSFLHDVIEDGFPPQGVILSLFGHDIYEWLLLLSKCVPTFDELTGEMIGRAEKSAEEYFFALQRGPIQPKVVKLADRLRNLQTIGVQKPERQLRKVKETRTYVLPIAAETDVWFHRELTKLCDSVEAIAKSELSSVI